MNQAILPLPMLRPGYLLRLWTVVLLATAGYCELSQLTQNGQPAEPTITLLWSAKVWAVWVGLSALLATQRGRSRLAALWQRRVLRVALLLLVPALALTNEWLAGAVFNRAGWLEGAYSIGELLFRRLPLYVAALVVFAYVLRQLRALPHEIAKAPVEVNTFTVTTSRGTIDIPIQDIEVIVAAENYVELCLTNGKQYLHRATLTSVHESLSPAGLARVHRSTIVNPRHVVERLPHRRLRLRSGRIVRVGRAFRAALH